MRMDFKVIKPFIDSQTDIGYNEGSTFESEDLERVSFLSENGFINNPAKNKTTRKRTTRKKVADDHAGKD